MQMSRHSAATSAEWWRQAVVYEIYPRSFADSDGDGLGDLSGISSRVPYLAALGIDAVWLSPFYPSALVDGGYDVDDYRNVDPNLGTLADFDELTARLHANGIRVIVDIVPNHTSSRHAWFAEALAAPRGSPARARYIFRDGQGLGGTQPPSDWLSMFGGSAWTRVSDGQWYLHLFAAEQPDLNWENREVRDDFLTTLRFWSDRGVDGFRVDVAHGLAKNLAEPLEPLAAGRHPAAEWAGQAGTHPLWDRDEVHDIYAEWRQVFNEYDPPRAGVAEAWVHPSRRLRYASPSGLGQAFNFDLLEANWTAGEFLRVITDALADAQRHGASTTWVLSNHDVVRHATRYGLPAKDDLSSTENAKAWLLGSDTSPGPDRGLGLRRARAAIMLMLALPGSAYLYQGEELGLHEVADIPAERIQDPAFLRSGGADKGRDGCRVPLPWTEGGPSFGFGTTAAHLPQPTWFGSVSVEAQEHDPASTLALYRRALGWRRRLQTAESLEWMPDTGAQVLHVRRPNGWQSVTNFGPGAVSLPPGNMVLVSGHLVHDLLPADTTAWIIPDDGTRRRAVDLEDALVAEQGRGARAAKAATPPLSRHPSSSGKACLGR
jgi:alpha-glucosidase